VSYLDIQLFNQYNLGDSIKKDNRICSRTGANKKRVLFWNPSSEDIMA